MCKIVAHNRDADYYQMQWITRFLNRRWWNYQWRYLRGQTPWDTNITPPEVVDYLKTAAPGRALDLGCGTGTNAVAMTLKGWQVMGIDYVPQAIHKARRKADGMGLSIDFRVGDVLALPRPPDPFDYILDIGCLHSLDAADHPSYAQQVTQMLAPSGVYMLYAWMPCIRNGKTYGLTEAQTNALFVPPLKLQKAVVGEEKGSPSVWYWFAKH
jgi:2-polyprenyl-3-methyl-5-hydroxy-6-metoxy-1,4-benzoquinol methylase